MYTAERVLNCGSVTLHLSGMIKLSFLKNMHHKSPKCDFNVGLERSPGRHFYDSHVQHWKISRFYE